MKRLGFALLYGFLIAVSPVSASESSLIEKSEKFTCADLGLTVISLTANIPYGDWEAQSTGSELKQVQILPASAFNPKAQGRRVRLAEIDSRTKSSSYKWDFYSLWSACHEFAVKNNGIGPSKLEELDQEKIKNFLAAMNSSPWKEDKGKALNGPFVFLIPDTPIFKQRQPYDGAPMLQPLAIELRPLLDDGKHWVLLNDGRMERRVIDQELLEKYNLKITFALTKEAIEKNAPETESEVKIRIFALLTDPGAESADLMLINRDDGEKIKLKWKATEAEDGGERLLKQWAEIRAYSWGTLARLGESSILKVWAGSSGKIYGVNVSESLFGLSGNRNIGRNTDAFGVLGGRAALRETLQMQGLTSSASQGAEEKTIQISEIKGVEVKSHPFDQLLAGKDGGRLALADHAPSDRFFLYFSKPEALFPFLDEGGEFLFRGGSLFTKNWVDDNIKDRYLAKLGMDEKLCRKIFKSGKILELAITSPDLFFIDGTDITVLIRAKRPDKLLKNIENLNLEELNSSGMTQLPLPSGKNVFWGRKGDIVFVGSSRGEMKAALALGGEDGAESLGNSSEFKYMLTKLPLNDDTRAYCYFSDPFIRKLVSPAVKINQLRRLRARADMEIIAAGELLSIYDGNKGKQELDRLVELGYAPEAAISKGYELGEDLSVRSPTWGTLADMTGLGEVPMEFATKAEADAYKNYRDNYDRYWRQYFDPVAMRLDDGDNGELKLETFILPLLDSQVYSLIRAASNTAESGLELKIPTLKPEPVLTLSLNLNEDAWINSSKELGKILTRFAGINAEILDFFGPGVHLALQDADPIILLGNADILGAFSGPGFTSRSWRSGFPLLLSMLTRPCKLLIELKDEKAVVDMLRGRNNGLYPLSVREMQMCEFRKIGDGDSWMLTINAGGFAKIRFGLEVQNGYLIVSNTPWSNPITVGKAKTDKLNGADLQIATGAVKLGLPGLFATASEQDQAAAIKGMGALYPLLLTVSDTPQKAAERHLALFGSKPLHPGKGEWVWENGKISSSLYGSPAEWRQPTYKDSRGDFGLFEGVEQLSVNMQFEENGLRSICRWVWSGN